MAKRSTGLHPVDLVWRLASDRRWHRLKRLEERIALDPELVRQALGFLVDYRFAQLSLVTESFRLIPGTPSPSEVVEWLRGSLAMEDA
jgi:hypothetical protein